MRLQFLKPRKDVVSAEQVRALRELRGWTAEQLADEVHASPLEVSAWEAGMVAVPSKQALLIRWHTERAAWGEALHNAQERTCPWVRENAPDLYEQIFRKPGGSRYTRDEPVRAHLAGCARCSDVCDEAQRIGRFPAKPDTSGSPLARYRRWVDRLPRWAQPPFALAGAAVQMTLPVALVAFVAPDAWIGFLLGFAAFAATTEVVVRVSRGPVAGFLPVLAAVPAGLLGWSIFPENDFSSPLPWACGAILIAAAGLGRFRSAKAGRTAQALEAAPAAPALSPPLPDLAVSLQSDRPSATAR